MKKFGIGKSKGEEDDQSRSKLFGSKKSKSSALTPAASNPYAAAANNPDPYAQPYTQPSSGYQQSSRPNYGAPSKSGYGDDTRASMASQPPAYDRSSYGGMSNAPMNDKSPVPLGGYGNDRYSNPGRGPQGYGGGDRYGADRSGSSSRLAAPSNSYGGLGRSKSSDTMATDAGRDQLFGGAKQRFDERKPSDMPPEQDPAQGGVSNQYSNDASSNQGYGGYQERELTAEEQEEEDVQGSKQQIRQIKQQDVSSTRNALRIAQQAEETGRATLERLGAQGERIHNTEKNLDLSSNQNRLAEEKARELKHLNRSMFAVQVNNPFTKSRRKNDRDEAIMSTHRTEREQRDATRAAAYQSMARRDETQREIRGPAGSTIEKKSNLAERSKYQFEADSEDEAMEEEIDSNLDALSGAAGRLNLLGRAMGKEVDTQNEHIGRIVGKADKVDDQIAMNRARLDRIR